MTTEPRISPGKKDGVPLTWGHASNPRIRTHEARVHLLSALHRLCGDAYRELMEGGEEGIADWQARYRLPDDWVRDMAEATIAAGVQDGDFPWTLPLWSLEEPGPESPERFAVPQPSLLKVRVQTTWYPDEESRATVRERLLARCAKTLDDQLAAIEARSSARETPPRIHAKEAVHFEMFVRRQCRRKRQADVANSGPRKVDRASIRDAVASVAALTGTRNLTIGPAEAS